MVDAHKMARDNRRVCLASFKSTMRLAVRAAPRPRKRKSAKAVTGDILEKLIATRGTENLPGLRDRAIPMFIACFRRWAEQGVWDALLETLVELGLTDDLQHMIDSTTVRGHSQAGHP